MKELIRIFSILLSIMFMLTSFQSCSNKTESSSTQTTPLAENEITEATLPKGKLVIEEVPKHVEKPIVITPISGNNPKNSETNSSTTKTAETRGETLQKKYRSLLVFHADDTMEVNRPKLAVLVLAKNESVEKLKMEVLDEANARDEKIKTDTTMDFGSKMKARLIAFGGSKVDSDFEIEPLGDDEQSFKTDRKKILWQWKITPLKAGQHELKLTIQIIEKDGEAVSLPARNIPVVIFAKEEGFMSKVGNFFATKYEWIITAVMIPLVIAVVNNRMRGKGHKQTTTQPDSKV